MESIHELFGRIREHPDFCGGTVFTTEDVAEAIFEPEDGWGGEKWPEDEKHRITPEIQSQAIHLIDSYIFNGAYSWRDALRENIEVTTDEVTS